MTRKHHGRKFVEVFLASRSHSIIIYSRLIIKTSTSRPWIHLSAVTRKHHGREFVEVFLVSRSHSVCVYSRRSDSASLRVAVCIVTNVEASSRL